jgi:hypothetical protein
MAIRPANLGHKWLAFGLHLFEQGVGALGYSTYRPAVVHGYVHGRRLHVQIEAGFITVTIE